MSAAQHTSSRQPIREVRWVHLGLAEARFYIGCREHMHVFRRVGYRSGAFIEDAVISKTAAGGAA